MATYKVDDASGTDSPASSVYKTIQYAIDDINGAHSSGLTKGTYGDRLNVRNTGTYSESALDFSTYAPASSTPIMLIGTTSGDVVDLDNKAVIDTSTGNLFSAQTNGVLLVNLDKSAIRS